MDTISQHIKDTLNLSNSLVLKLNSSAYSINKGVAFKYNTPISRDKRTWKYYLNLAGQKHETNKSVFINTVEDKTEIELTPINLSRYEYTRKELSKFGDLYNKLLLKYPDEESYIKGVISPVDIEEAIDAEDGDILTYNKNLVEQSELSLIPELQKHIKDFLNRWYNPKYGIAEELYTPALQAILYTSIFNKILNIRLDKIRTNEAHSFHLESYFNSTFNLWNDISIFKLSTKYWLYRHLPFISKRLGQHRTLEEIIDKVLDENNIGAAEYIISYKDPVLNNNPKSELPYDQPEASIIVKAKNESYDIGQNGYREIAHVVQDELNLIRSTIDRELEDNYIISNTIKELNNINHNRKNQELSKVIDVKLNDIFKMYNLDIFTVVFDYWAYKSKHNHDTYVVEWLDPNDLSQSFKLNYYQAFLIATKLLLKIIGKENYPIKGYNYNTVLNSNKNSLIYMYNKMYKDGITGIHVDDLNYNYPKVDAFLFSPERSKEYIQNIFKFQSYIWLLDCNSEGIIQSAAIKQLMYYTYQKGMLDFNRSIPLQHRNDNGYNIDTLLKREGIKYNIKNTFDLMKSLNDLVKTVWGINIDWYYTRDEILGHVKSFLSKLTSYTTQIISLSGDVKSIYLYYNSVNLFKAKNAIIGDIKGRFCGLEHKFSRIKAVGHNIIDDPIRVIENYDKKRSNYEIIPMESGIGNSNYSYPVIRDNEWWKDPTILNVKTILLSHSRDIVDIEREVPVTITTINTKTTNRDDIINTLDDREFNIDINYPLDKYLNKEPVEYIINIDNYDQLNTIYNVLNTNDGINITKEGNKLKLLISEAGYRTFVLNSIKQEADPLQDIRYPDKSTIVTCTIDDYDSHTLYKITANPKYIIEYNKTDNTIVYVRQPDSISNIKVKKVIIEKASGDYITKIRITNFKRYLNYNIRSLDDSITNIKQEEDLITYSCPNDHNLGIEITATINYDKLPIVYNTVEFDKRRAPRQIVELRDEMTYDKNKSEHIISKEDRLKQFLDMDVNKPTV